MSTQIQSGLTQIVGILKEQWRGCERAGNWKTAHQDHGCTCHFCLIDKLAEMALANTLRPEGDQTTLKETGLENQRKAKAILDGFKVLPTRKIK